jgi:hypothetical protein
MNYESMSDIDKVIHELFSNNWHGEIRDAPIEIMRKQLHKNLNDQLNGYWSGHTAYHIMTKGGFLIDSKRVSFGGNKCKPKELTAIGLIFMESMEAK